MFLSSLDKEFLKSNCIIPPHSFRYAISLPKSRRSLYRLL